MEGVDDVASLWRLFWRVCRSYESKRWEKKGRTSQWRRLLWTLCWCSPNREEVWGEAEQFPSSANAGLKLFVQSIRICARQIVRNDVKKMRLKWRWTTLLASVQVPSDGDAAKHSGPLAKNGLLQPKLAYFCTVYVRLTNLEYTGHKSFQNFLMQKVILI